MDAKFSYQYTHYVCSHWLAGSTEGAPPGIILVCWSHILVHVFLQRMVANLIQLTTRTHYSRMRYWVYKHWPEQICRWHLLLLPYTTVWSVFQTPSRIMIIKKFVSLTLSWRSSHTDTFVCRSDFCVTTESHKHKCPQRNIHTQKQVKHTNTPVDLL